MAIRSMTGFGRAAVTVGDVVYSVEVRSVNHRFLDLRVRVPRELAAGEALIRARVQTRLRRGRIEVNVQSQAEVDQDLPPRLAVNLHLARTLKEAHEQLSRALNVPMGLDTTQIAAWPGVLVPAGPEVAPAELEARVGEAMDQALDLLVGMRAREGAALEMELLHRLDAVESLRGRLVERAPEQARLYRARLEARIKEMLLGLDVQAEPSRVLHEVACFAERVDVEEELSRLGSHGSQARLMLTDPDAAEDGVGRRLDFLCQEMHREANTIGSKVQDVALSEAVIELKAELERLREQVQNVE